MYILLIIITILVCLFLGFIVLIQNPKGGGLSSNFSSSSQLMGVQKTGDFLEKGTWILAIGLMILSMAINVAVKSGTAKSDNAEQVKAAQEASKPVNSAAPGNFGPQTQKPAAGTPLPQPTTPPAKK
jgi:preprotein translocase subunit SecG